MSPSVRPEVHSDRTVRRDIEALEAAGFPVERIANPDDPQGGDRFRIEASVKVAKHLTLTARELFALYMARGMLAPLKDSAFFVDLERVVKHADGSATLHLEVGLTPDLVQFVLGFGDAVEVRVPDELKHKVLEAALRVANLYSAG